MSTVLYRVERLGSEELGRPVELERALEQVKARVPKETEGALRIVRIAYGLDPRAVPTIHTPAIAQCWAGTIEHFTDIGDAGIYVCKAASEHRYGNAVDWTAPKSADTDSKIIAYLWRVFYYCRTQGMIFESSSPGGLPYSEVIFRDKISTRAYDWTIRPYTGIFHASHVHGSGYPLIPTSKPCGQV